MSAQFSQLDLLAIAGDIVAGSIEPYPGAAAIWRLLAEVGEDYPDGLREFVGLASEWEDAPEHRETLEVDIVEHASAVLRQAAASPKLGQAPCDAGIHLWPGTAREVPVGWEMGGLVVYRLDGARMRSTGALVAAAADALPGVKRCDGTWDGLAAAMREIAESACPGGVVVAIFRPELVLHDEPVQAFEALVRALRAATVLATVLMVEPVGEAEAVERWTEAGAQIVRRPRHHAPWR